MRSAADAVRVCLVCAAAALFVAGDAAIAAKFVLVLPATAGARLVRVHPVADLAFTLALAAEAAGSALAAHELIGWDDRVSHLVLPLLLGVVVYTALRRTRAARRPAAAGLMTGIAVLAIAALWEIVEWAVDTAFGTNFSTGRDDTVGDLSADAVAAAGAGAAAAVLQFATARTACRSGGSV
jgi:hypothetical protein